MLKSDTWSKDELEKWSKLASQGVGVWAFKHDKVNNDWLINLSEPKIREANLITALQLRVNTLPTILTIKGKGSKKATGALLCRLC